MKIRYLALCLLAALLVSCGAPSASPTPAAARLALTSPAFGEAQAIPAVYTCRGQNISLPLAWDAPPPAAKSLALLMLDPDANNFVHWLLFNLPVSARSLPEALPAQARYPDGAQAGLNSWGKNAYGGPCPPTGVHHYVITLYALDQTLALTEQAGAADFLKAIEGHVLAEGQLSGTYQK